MTDILDNLTLYIAQEVDNLQAADLLLDQLREKVLDKLEDDYHY